MPRVPTPPLSSRTYLQGVVDNPLLTISTSAMNISLGTRTVGQSFGQLLSLDNDSSRPDADVIS